MTTGVPVKPLASRPLGYQSGLDGLRALALLAIFVVHADVGLASGGFLAVSTFFTLSGFLITSLVIGERANTGRLDLKAFWTRRARRLLPAALVAIAAIVVATVAIGSTGQLHRVQGDAAAALTYVANWRFILIGDQYGARFESESPLTHFWSLAIEEQFYVIFPLVLTFAFAMAKRWRGAVVAVLISLLVASQLAGIVLSITSSVDRLYFGTDVRAAELLVGALIAWWWIPRRAALEPKVHKPLRVIGPVLLVVMGALIATAKSSDLFWYRGGLALYAVITCTVVIASTQSNSPFQRALSWKPLVWIGVVSYGAYLVHWPIYVWLRSGTHLDGYSRLFIGGAAAIGLATLSYLLIEHPFRRTKHIPRAVLIATPLALAVIALSATVIIPPSSAQTRDIPLEERRALLDEKVSHGADGRPKLAFFGDSTALSLSIGLATWDDEPSSTMSTVDGWTGLGCTVMAPIPLIDQGRETVTTNDCTNYLQGWKDAIVERQPQIGVLEVGGWEVCDMQLPGHTEFTALGNPEHDAAVKARLKEAATVMANGVQVPIIVTSPYVKRSADGRYPEDDPARMDRMNQLIREVVAEDQRLLLIDLAGYIDSLPNQENLRPDGVHLSWEGATEVARWLGPLISEKAGIGGPR